MLLLNCYNEDFKFPSHSPEMRTRNNYLLRYYTLKTLLHTELHTMHNALYTLYYTQNTLPTTHCALHPSHCTKLKALATAVKDSVLRFLASEFAWFIG